MMARIARRSCVFIVRTWTEARGEHWEELRGMVRELQSGETRYFRTWEELLAFVERHHEVYERRDRPFDESK